jgi:hypothetical protein
LAPVFFNLPVFLLYQSCAFTSSFGFTSFLCLSQFFGFTSFFHDASGVVAVGRRGGFQLELVPLGKHLGPILQNSVEDKNFSDQFSSSNI